MSEIKFGALFGKGGNVLKVANGSVEYWLAGRLMNPLPEFDVPSKAVETVTVTKIGKTNGMLQLIGKGEDLAHIEMPYTWAKKAQDFLLKELGL